MALTKKQKDVFDFICDYIDREGCSPTQKEIQVYFGLKSLGSVQDYIKYLIQSGHLINDPHSVRGIIPRQKPSPQHANLESELPLLGKIAAGLPIEAVENAEMISVPHSFLAKGASYALRVQGESMIEAGILHGDIAIIKHQTQAQNGQIVVAVMNEDTTLKTYIRKNRQIELHPANRAFSPIILDEKDCEIRGVLIGLLRHY